MTIKEKVFSKLEELCETLDSNKEGITANEIAKILNVQRNVVSQYLNELCREGKVVKTNTRPVYFLDIKKAHEKKDSEEEVLKITDPFSKVIGSNGSLKDQIEQCKAAAVYPNKGLPITLTGDSGVGKSFIARVIYEYAVYKNCIGSDAPFITFNCADYANNKELLSANLFGYKKGAFTGADKDTTGLIEAADNGYLFLDEVHRLSPEGQEKLFLFLDQGKFRRIGETNKWRSANVRFIFATTENLEEVLLDTFRRRIPIFVEIPNLSNRTISERLAMIYNFYQGEAKEMKKELIINKNVVNSLLSISGNGNIGLLKNVIISSCANSYRTHKDCKDVLNINIDSLPGKFKNSISIKNSFYGENMKITVNEDISALLNSGNDRYSDSIIQEFKLLFKLINSFSLGTIDYEKFKKTSTRYVNTMLKEIVFNNKQVEKDILTYDLVFNIVDNSLKFIQKNYGIKYYGNTTKVLTYTIIIIKALEERNIFSKNELKAYRKVVKKKLSNSYLVSKKLIEMIEGSLDTKLEDLVLIIMTLYINTMTTHDRNKINGIIVAHGFSTASSIASVANACFEEYIFEPFDMPIDVTTATITKKIKEHLRYIDTAKGVIILVDMGSLNEIYNDIKPYVNGDVGIINNISTRLSLDVANNIINKESVETIVKRCSFNNKTEFKYYEAESKKKAIVVTCISGVGTAEKIKNILTKCIGESEIEIITEDYDSVVHGLKDSKLKNYDVRLIISTTAIEKAKVQVIELQSLISGEGDRILEAVLGDIDKKKSIEEIKDDIIKLFSLQNIINQLTILNPTKIVDEVSKIINNYQITMNKEFSSELKLALFIHISSLIERLVLRDAIVTHTKEEIFKEKHMDFIEETTKIFSDILNEYKVTIPVAEIINIYYIIKLRENPKSSYYDNE